MIGSLFKVLEAGLGLWKSKESRKYLDRVIKLKKEFYEEYNKDDNVRSDAVLDNIQFELRLISDSFASQIGSENSENK